MASPTRTPVPEELRQIFGRNWSADCGWSLVEWSVGLLCAFDWAVNGTRPNEDMDRIKKSEVHDIDLVEGWGYTALKGGRAKLENKKRNTRPWKAWRPCLCSSRKHVPIPSDIEYDRWKRGNPTEAPTWCTGCPVSAMELLLRLQYPLYADDTSGRRWKGRMYRSWSHGKRAFNANNIGSPVGTAVNWVRLMGVKREFDTNAGRKSLARWSLKLNVPYAVAEIDS